MVFILSFGGCLFWYDHFPANLPKKPNRMSYNIGQGMLVLI